MRYDGGPDGQRLAEVGTPGVENGKGRRKRNGGSWATYIYGELAPDPDQLARVCLQLLDAAGMRLADVDGILSQRVDGVQVVPEHVRVLVILRRDVLPHRRRQRQLRAPAEGQGEDVALHVAAESKWWWKTRAGSRGKIIPRGTAAPRQGQDG